MVAHFRPLTVQYSWRISAKLVKNPCGLQLGDYWILDSTVTRIAGLLSSEAQSAEFKEFVWRFVNAMARALVA